MPSGLTARYDTLNGRVPLEWRKDATGKVQGYLLFRSAGVGDTGLVRIAYRNANRENILLRAGAVGSDSALARIALSGREGSVDVSLPCPAAGSRYFWIEAVNTDGTRWRDTLDFHVLQDPPTADAGPDTVIDFGTAFRFRGKAADKFGRVVSREWDFDGAGTRYSFVRVTGEDTVVTLDLAGARPYLRVTDDDGNAVVDSFRMAVRPRKPVLAAPTPGADGRSFSFRVASDRDADLDRYLLVYSDGPIADTASGTLLSVAAGDTAGLRLDSLFPSLAYRFRPFAVDSGGLVTAGEEITALTEMKTPWAAHGEFRSGALMLELHAHPLGNRIILFGERQRWTKSYNPVLRTYTELSPMVEEGSTPLVGFRKSIVVGSRIFVMGGVSANSPGRFTDNRAWSYATDRWTELNPLLDSRKDHALVARDGLVYCIAGDSLDPQGNGGRGTLAPTSGVLIYDISTGTWSQGPRLPVAGPPAAALVVDGILVCLAGGKRFELPRGATGWEDKGAVPTIRTAQYCDTTGKAYFFTPDSVSRYDARTGTFASRPFLGSRRQAHTVTNWNGMLLIIGGTRPWDISNSPTYEIDIYSPALDGL